MGDIENSLIRHADHILLDQPLIRLPHELLRNNFRLAHFHVEREAASLKAAVRDAATAADAAATAATTAGDSSAAAASPAEAVRAVDAALARLRATRARLAALSDEEAVLHRQLSQRAAHLDDLFRLRTVYDGPYKAWSRRRLDRLLVDYMLRRGYYESARMLAVDRGIEDLVDIDAFVAVGRIRDSLRTGNVTEALQWSLDNKKELRKMDCNLEFMLRFQQYIELVRDNGQAKRLEARLHAQKYLLPFRDTYLKELRQACGLLAFFSPPDPSPDPPWAEPAVYASLWNPDRWEALANLFTKAHSDLLTLPSVPLLHIALSSGLSALKTPACHSRQFQMGKRPHLQLHQLTGLHAGSSGDPEGGVIRIPGPGQTVCPICSTELNELARSVPYAHHTQSHIESGQMLLPNGRAYSLQRLLEHASKAGLPEGKVKDLRTGEVYDMESLRKVYVT